MAKYRMNRRETGRMMKSPMVYDILRKPTRDGAQILKETVNTDSGHYEASVDVEYGWDTMKRDRAAGFIVADNDYATVLEVGNARIDNPPRPMEQTLKTLRAKYGG